MRNTYNIEQPSRCLDTSMRCDICKLETDRPYWHRDAPDVILCIKCFSNPTDVLVRRKIAAELLRIRAEHGRHVAKKVHRMLRGTGVPTRRLRDTQAERYGTARRSGQSYTH